MTQEHIPSLQEWRNQSSKWSEKKNTFLFGQIFENVSETPIVYKQLPRAPKAMAARPMHLVSHRPKNYAITEASSFGKWIQVAFRGWGRKIMVEEVPLAGPAAAPAPAPLPPSGRSRRTRQTRTRPSLASLLIPPEILKCLNPANRSHSSWIPPPIPPFPPNPQLSLGSPSNTDWWFGLLLPCVKRPGSNDYLDYTT